MTNELGRHLIVDLSGCNSERLKFLEEVAPVLTEAAEACNASILTKSFHQFEPFGVSGVILIAESHLSIHTWPEENYAAVDIFTCSAEMDMEAAVEILKHAFQASEIKIAHHNRGNNPNISISTEHRISSKEENWKSDS